MENYVFEVNKILAIGTILMQVFILLLAVNLIFFKKYNNKFLVLVKKYTFHLGFLASFSAVILSLYYSNIVGYPACELCWVQRIFIYPQMILFGVELYRRDRTIIPFSLVFALLGAITSIYHIYVENGGTRGLACADPSNGGVSCAVRYIYEFGYVTMPIMCLTISIFIIAILLNYKFISRMK